MFVPTVGAVGHAVTEVPEPDAPPPVVAGHARQDARAITAQEARAALWRQEEELPFLARGVRVQDVQQSCGCQHTHKKTTLQIDDGDDDDYDD